MKYLTIAYLALTAFMLARRGEALPNYPQQIDCPNLENTASNNQPMTKAQVKDCVVLEIAGHNANFTKILAKLLLITDVTPKEFDREKPFVEISLSSSNFNWDSVFKNEEDRKVLNANNLYALFSNQEGVLLLDRIFFPKWIFALLYNKGEKGGEISNFITKELQQIYDNLQKPKDFNFSHICEGDLNKEKEVVQPDLKNLNSLFALTAFTMIHENALMNRNYYYIHPFGLDRAKNTHNLLNKAITNSLLNSWAPYSNVVFSQTNLMAIAETLVRTSKIAPTLTINVNFIDSIVADTYFNGNVNSPNLKHPKLALGIFYISQILYEHKKKFAAANFSWDYSAGIKAVVRHEVGHLLGLDHEFLNPNAAGYFYLNPENYTSGYLNHFTSYSAQGMSFSIFDKYSIMNYFYNPEDVTFIKDLEIYARNKAASEQGGNSTKNVYAFPWDLSDLDKFCALHIFGHKRGLLPNNSPFKLLSEQKMSNVDFEKNNKQLGLDLKNGEELCFNKKRNIEIIKYQSALLNFALENKMPGLSQIKDIDLDLIWDLNSFFKQESLLLPRNFSSLFEFNELKQAVQTLQATLYEYLNKDNKFATQKNGYQGAEADKTGKFAKLIKELADNKEMVVKKWNALLTFASAAIQKEDLKALIKEKYAGVGDALLELLDLDPSDSNKKDAEQKWIRSSCVHY